MPTPTFPPGAVELELANLPENGVALLTMYPAPCAKPHAAVVYLAVGSEVAVYTPTLNND